MVLAFSVGLAAIGVCVFSASTSVGALFILGDIFMSDEIFNQIQAYEKRVFFFIEEHNWEKANEYAEKILDIQPENATAYLAKLLIEFHCSSITDLSKLKNSFEENIWAVYHHALA